MKNGGAELRIFEGTQMPPVPETVEYLREALEWAKSGKLQSVVIGGVFSDGYATTAHTISPNTNPVLVLGCAEWARDRVMEVVYDSV